METFCCCCFSKTKVKRQAFTLTEDSSNITSQANNHYSEYIFKTVTNE